MATNANKRMFPTDFLKEIIDTGKDSPHNGEPCDEVSEADAAEILALKGSYAVLNELNGKARWANIYRCVFVLPDGSAWGTEYRVGTGDEGERPYEHEGERSMCHRVVAKEVTTTLWVRAEEAAS